MTYQAFKQVILIVLKRAGIPADGVKFNNNEDLKRYEAFVCGVRFTGNGVSKMISVKWGSGHHAVLDVA